MTNSYGSSHLGLYLFPDRLNLPTQDAPIYAYRQLAHPKYQTRNELSREVAALDD